MKIDFLRHLIFVFFISSLFFVSCDEWEDEEEEELPINLVNSTYSGTGSSTLDAPSSWSGNLVVNNDLNETYYTITNWANKALLYLDLKNEKLFLDGTTVLYEFDNLYWCIGVGYFDEMFYFRNASYQYEVKYDSATKTLDFSGTVDNRPAVIGLVGRDKQTGEVKSFSGDTFYSDAKLVLSPGH